MKVSYDFLCLDERDSPNLSEFKYKSRTEIKRMPSRRHFGIVGVIIPGAEYPQLNMKGRQIQHKCSGKYIPLHYVEILNKKQNYAFLGTDYKKERSAKDLLNNLVKDTRFKILASFIDKNELALQYGIYTKSKLSEINKIKPNLLRKSTPSNINLYYLALKFILIEYHKYLKGKMKRGLIIAEARGEKEDRDLLDAFYNFQKFGVGSLSGKELREYITDLLIIRKSQNHIGTQLADLITYPLYDYFIPNHNTRSDHFIKIESFEKKIHYNNTFPKMSTKTKKGP